MLAANLAFAFPVADILDATAAADIHVRPSTDEHVASWDDIRQRRVAGILSWYPNRDRDVVGCSAEGYREEAVETEKELGPPVVIRCR